MTVGIAIAAAAMLIFSQLTIDSSPIQTIIGLVMLGSGMGAFGSANNSAILSSIGRGKFGIGAGVLSLIRTSGSVTGVALAATIVALTMTSLGHDPSLAGISQTDNEGVRTAFIAGIHNWFLTAATLFLMATVLSILRGTDQTVAHPNVYSKTHP